MEKNLKQGRGLWSFSTIPIALFLKLVKRLVANSPVEEFFQRYHLDQMGLTAILSMIVIAIVSIKENEISNDKKAIKLDKDVFDTSLIYNIGSFILMILLAFLYSFFW